jgi:hypothetical protein
MNRILITGAAGKIGNTLRRTPDQAYFSLPTPILAAALPRRKST